jgi:YVTN family beta-propeller protein
MRTNKIVKEIPAGDTPNHTTLSKDNQLLFVTNALSDTLSVIDIKKQINIKEIKVGDEPLSSTLSPNGKLLYVVNYGGRHEKSSISVIDTTELKEIKRIKIDRYPRAVAVVEADI